VAKFEAENYSRFRVFYPSSLFAGIRASRVLDLGAGTGFSAHSFLKFDPYAELTLVEPDGKMLARAKELFANDANVRFVQRAAEAFDWPVAYDLVLIGSAWHWMDRTVMQKQFEAADVGAVFIFEYQFPKAKFKSELNEWVRREFNLRWRTREQIPRGNLEELTEGLRNSKLFSQVKQIVIPHEELFSVEDFFGMIISQSRFLAYEATLELSERNAYRQKLFLELKEVWGLQKEEHESENKLMFHLPYEGLLFRRRMI
jgi:SAM-dependent methyltransferase